ncbi:hypothetical protein EVAR_86092_1 [Eumeta japonica]|uniref:Uncharacterized protein n=1 Tax=Eumeta variegata TaxID=151549 RepID=A0A4C1V169_EUMVA|nr:hypothetical protein EVAR_86092_1 [Eumeta japonica]
MSHAFSLSGSARKLCALAHWGQKLLTDVTGVIAGGVPRPTGAARANTAARSLSCKCNVRVRLPVLGTTCACVRARMTDSVRPEV